MKKTTKWLLGILIAVILIGLGVYLLIKFNHQTSTSAESANNDTAAAEQAQNGAGWQIYKNFAHGFLIEYPDGATVTNAGGDDTAATSAYCVKIATKYVWVKIASRDIPDNVMCLSTGFGTEWSNALDETVTAAGQTYTAKGMKTEAASAGYYQDDYLITTLSGEKIEYGIDVNEKNDPAMTQAQAKELVHKMVSSFSPAE